MINTASFPRPMTAAATVVQPKDAGTDAVFNYNSQDSTVFDPGTVVIHNMNAGDAPSNDKVKLNTPLAPSAPGQYVFKEGDTNEVAAQTFSTVAHTVDLFSQAIGAPINWAFGDPQLQVNFDKGEDFNAYYMRDDKSVNFFHATDTKTNQVLYSGDSGEVVSHETGHALLDSFRPAFFSSFTPDVAAFHESMGDMMGLCMAMQDPRGIAKVVQQTGGDLSKPNIFAATGEQLGIGINDSLGNGTSVTGGDYVRNALNTFKWADPSTLDSNNPDPSKLGSEAHDFSRLWTGAFYDVLTAIQKENLAANPNDPAAALTATGKEAIKLLAELVRNSPQGDFTYADMAKAWIAGDQKDNGGQRADLITKVMTDRGILGAQPTPPPTNFVADGSRWEEGSPEATDNSFTFSDKGMKPLSTLTHPVTVTLGKSVPEEFQGAKVTTLVDNDGSLSKDADSATRMKASVAQAIKAGRVLVTTPGQKLTTKDYFDKQGRPYLGVLKYNNDGSKTIERVKIAG